MRTVRRVVVAFVIVVASTLVVGMAINLDATQDRGRQWSFDTLERRTEQTGTLIAGAFTASNSPESVRAEFGGSLASVRAAVTAQAAASQGRDRVMVLDAGGRVLASSPASLRRDRGLLARSPHLRRALAGTPSLSDVFRDAKGRQVIEIAIPFQTPSGRRVLAGSGPLEIVRSFTATALPTASVLRGSRMFLLDGNGRTLTSTAARPQDRRPSPDPRALAALERSPSGTVGDRTYFSAPVPASNWRVVVTVPTAELYTSVDGGPADAAWRLFGAFAFAILALLGLGLAAVRNARRLAASTERELAARQLAHARLHDPLTGLPNRSLLLDRADHAIAAARRRGRSVALLFMDVDHFKRINDSLGHEGGDAVLAEVAQRLAHSVRAVDTVSRFGGDEFVVLCEDVPPDDAFGLARTVQHALAGPVAACGREVPVTFSIGLAVHGGRDDARTAADLLRDADVAMYRAKDLGRGRTEVFDAELHQRAQSRLDAEVALRRAIDEDELLLHYQPIVALPEGAVRGVEALVRWRRPETGELVPPGDFIGLAEETGLIADLGAWVLRTAVRDVAAWDEHGLIDDEFLLSVNVSARQLSGDALTGVVTSALASWSRPASGLVLEITESAVMADPAVAERTLERLAQLGVRLALDDFGVGHSSLGQLARSLPISMLKLDRSFVDGMSGPRDRGIVEAACSLARALDLEGVAEGIETPEQAAAIAAMGFPYAQGFHFGRPVPCDELAARLGDYARSL